MTVDDGDGDEDEGTDVTLLDPVTGSLKLLFIEPLEDESLDGHELPVKENLSMIVDTELPVSSESDSIPFSTKQDYGNKKKMTRRTRSTYVTLTRQTFVYQITNTTQIDNHFFNMLKH